PYPQPHTPDPARRSSDLKATSPSDGYGHGTHVAGLIAGSGALTGGSSYQGMAPQARLIGMKVLDATGAGRTSDVIRAVEYATAQDRKSTRLNSSQEGMSY